MTTDELRHAIAACSDVHDLAPAHIKAMRKQIGDQINVVRSPGRELALEAARPLGRMVEYYEARDCELTVLLSIIDRGSKGLPIEPHFARVDKYWERIVDRIRELGPNPTPRMMHGPITKELAERIHAASLRGKETPP